MNKTKQISPSIQEIDRKKQEGAHFTPSCLARFVTERLLRNKPINKDEEVITVLDPAIGDGELIIAFLNMVPEDCYSKISIIGYDINKDSLLIAEKRIKKISSLFSIKLYNVNYLDDVLQDNTLFCKNDSNPLQCDYIIANPPYIRTQILGTERAKKIARDWNLKGRLDIYQAFMLAISRQMKNNTISAFITSNRYLTIEGCATFREKLLKLYTILELCDFGDTALFSAAVLPVVTIFRLKQQIEPNTKFTSIYKFHKKDKDGQSSIRVLDPVEGIDRPGVVQDKNGNLYISQSGNLSITSSNAPWALTNHELTQWLSIVQANTALTFGDVGKIRVGVKTTADNVFIHNNWIEETDCEPELLLPLVTHTVSGQFIRSKKIETQILYPHFYKDGKRFVYDINKYPIACEYLNKHKEQLSGRKYISDAGRKWYEIWVPQKPELWDKEKIVFRDISEQPMFWFEPDCAVINGDCYWMILDSKELPKDVLWLLLAVANSSFIERYYDCCFNNKLYSNKRRFISQYVEKFPLPDWKTNIAIEIIEMSKKMYYDGRPQEDKIRIDLLVSKAFGLP